MNRRQGIVLAALVGLFIATYLTLYKLGIIATLPCTGISSCEEVQGTRWASFLGLPVALWGAGYYVTVLTLALAGLTERYEGSRSLARTLALLTGWGLLFSGWLTSLEAFQIHYWCIFCLASASIAVVLFALAALDYRSVAAETATATATRRQGP